MFVSVISQNCVGNTCLVCFACYCVFHHFVCYVGNKIGEICYAETCENIYSVQVYVCMGNYTCGQCTGGIISLWQDDSL